MRFSPGSDSRSGLCSRVRLHLLCVPRRWPSLNFSSESHRAALERQLFLAFLIPALRAMTRTCIDVQNMKRLHLLSSPAFSEGREEASGRTKDSDQWRFTPWSSCRISDKIPDLRGKYILIFDSVSGNLIPFLAFRPTCTNSFEPARKVGLTHDSESRVLHLCCV
jgi:hypothetical protein